MRVPVLIDPLPDQRFRARGVAWDISAEGQTSDEALRRLQAELQQRIANGSQVVFLETESSQPAIGAEHPLARYAGCMKDDPLYDEWQAAVAEYRAQCDRVGE